MKKEQWYDIFDRSKNAGKSLVRMHNLASALATIVTIGIIAITISYVLITTNLIFTVRNTFLPTSDVTLVPSSSPSCVGDYTLTVGDNSIDCLGTSPSKVVCANGYEGVLFEGVLLCPIDNQIILPGSQCANGGFVLFYQNANQTFNVTTCFAIEPAQITCANGLPGIQLGNVTVCNVQFTSTGSGTVSLIQNSTSSSLLLRELQSNVPHLSITATNGAAVFSSDVICSDGRPSALFNGVAYCNLFMNVTSNAATCNGGTRYDLYGNGTLLQHFCSSQQLTNSSSVDFITTANTVTANAKVTTSDATTGGETLVSSYAGNNIVFKQLLDIPGFLEYSSTSTSVQLVSFIDANNIPWTGFNPLLFPDCPLSTDISDFLTCLAGRTISVLTNATNAANVIYYPTTLFKNQSSFSVASAFDILFEDTLPVNTRRWFVDSINGDDVLGNGSPLNPFATIGHTLTLIGTFSHAQSNEVVVSLGMYDEGSLLLPPNTFIVASNPMRIANIIVNGSISLRSDWATYANAHVEGGFNGFTIEASSITLNFTGMGATGVNSFSKFSFSDSEIDAPITVNGRNNADFVHFSTVDIDQASSFACVRMNMEYNVVEASISITDGACGAAGLLYHFIFNYFEHSNLTIVQSTSSNMVVDLFLNGWDQGYVFGFGNFTCNTYTMPINFMMAGTVNIVHNLNLAGSAMCGLNVAYWGASCLNADDMMLVLEGRAKTAASAGVGVSLISSTTPTTNFFNSLSSLTSAFGISQSLGNIYFDIITANLLFGLINPFRGQSSISFAYLAAVVFDEVLPSVTNIWWVDPVNGDDSFGTGAPNNKFKTIEFTFSMIGTFPATQIQQVMLVPGTYNENNILWPPNTYVVGFGSREDRVVVSTPNNVELRSDWSTYANDRVEAGIENVEWTCAKFVLDFNGVMGGAGLSSDANFNFYNAFIDAVYIISGRGETDHMSWRETVVLLNMDPDCVSIYSRDSDFNGNVAITDNNCAGTNLVMELLYNKFSASFAATRSGAATFMVQSSLNTFTLGAGTSFNGAITLSANGLPPDVVIDPSATLTNLLGANSVVMYGLPTPYYTSTELPMTDIINTITPRAKSLTHSGVGSSPIFSTSTTTDTLNGFSGTINQFTFTAGGGALTGSIPSDFRPPGVIYLASTTSITAAGATQGTATALSATALEHFVTTVAASTGVRLPTPAAAGAKYTIYNRGANALNVYPAVGGVIDAGAVNAPVVIPVATAIQVSSASGTQWFTSEAAIVGGGGIGVSYGLGQTTITALGVTAGFSNTAPLTITNPGAAVFTTIVPAGTGSLTYNASTLAAGSKICVIAKGIFASASATTVTFRWRLDGITVYGPSNSVTPGAVTGVRFNFDTCLLILTDGVGGTALPVGEMEISTTQVATIPNAIVATAIDTTVSHTVAVEMAYSTLNAANTNRISSFYMTHVRT